LKGLSLQKSTEIIQLTNHPPTLFNLSHFPKGYVPLFSLFNLSHFSEGCVPRFFIDRPLDALRPVAEFGEADFDYPFTSLTYTFTDSGIFA